MNALRVGDPVTYRMLDRKTLEPVEHEGVVRALYALVWCGPLDAPTWQCDPVPYSWVEPRSLNANNPG